MAITLIQYDYLVSKCNNCNMGMLMEQCDMGNINIDEGLNAYALVANNDGTTVWKELPLSDERKRALVNRPNRMEQKEWGEIQSLMNAPSPVLLQKIETYISNWEKTQPLHNHIEEAQSLLSSIVSKIEENDWNNVNCFNYDSLLAHLKQYPCSSHFQEIDDNIWALLNKSSNTDMQKYLADMPQGRHAAEANQIVFAFHQWESIKQANDLIQTWDFFIQHPDNAFAGEVQDFIQQLKTEEVRRMRSEMTGYSIDRLNLLMSKGVFEEDELIQAGVLSSNILSKLQNLQQIKDNLPPIEKSISQCSLFKYDPQTGVLVRNEKCVCPPGTDVYLFGIPSTGKTCILMGLTQAPNINIDTASSGGDYAADLSQYVDVGMAVPRTPGEFVTIINALIFSEKKKIHNVNLVEMSGEEFAMKIARNQEATVVFDDMGTGATELLRNGNRKIFFFVIDPTTDVLKFKRLSKTTDETGNVQHFIEEVVVNQKVIIKKMIDMCCRPENAHIMKKVDAINFIITKSDTLDQQGGREQAAMAVFQSGYTQNLLRLNQLCAAHGINHANGGKPKLYTFSLGKFYIGGIYDYDSKDAMKIVDAIRNNTGGEKPKSVWGKIKNVVN